MLRIHYEPSHISHTVSTRLDAEGVLPKKKKDPRPGWEQVAALCGHARSQRASHDTKRKAQEALSVLGPVEREAFIGRVVKQNPDLERQMGKTEAEIDALVRSAKEKLADMPATDSGE